MGPLNQHEFDTHALNHVMSFLKCHLQKKKEIHKIVTSQCQAEWLGLTLVHSIKHGPLEEFAHLSISWYRLIVFIGTKWFVV